MRHESIPFSDWGIKPKKGENENQMSRLFSHPRAGDFCLEIIKKLTTEELGFHYDLLNLANNQVACQGLLRRNDSNRNKIKFGHLEAGEYKVTLRNISRGTYTSAELCPGLVNFEHGVTVS